MAPLAADVNRDGKYEIVVVGGSEDYGNDGSVTVLDGTNGNVIWTVKPYNSGTDPGIGCHTPFEIADLDLDGIPEIIVAARRGVLVLRGNNGSVYWRNTGAPAEENYIAVGDVDGDGHPEIFVCEGLAPYNGVDYITELSYDGRILRQAWNWHPCWGGLTLGDTNHDGIFELYQGDRNVGYSSSEDQYKGGGMGLRALDAKTLTPLWNDPTILCSSHDPILADVDKNGIQEVIVADQGTSGIAVLNSADGTVNGIRKAGTQMSAHSAPTVYDVDGDGNLEFMDCRGGSVVKIWDLYDWKLDATLPITCLEPPKLGNVTGADDGLLDIIAVTGATPTVAIYHYDKNTKTYQNPYNLTAPYSLLNANAFSLMQDVDDDGLNELILSSDTQNNGYVFCFDTQAKAPTPRARSELQFYSESRCGAAVYVPPLTPTAPVISDEQPLNRSLNQPLNPTLSVGAVDFKGPMDITFRSNSSGTWQILDSYTNVPNGTYPQRNPTGMNSYGTTYYWNVTATDGTNRTSNIYSFTTSSRLPAGSSVLVSSGGTNGTKENLICSNQSTTDPDGDKVTNIYSWNVNGNPLNTLILPFDTRTSSNPLVNETLFSDGFETGLGNWDGNGGSGWTRVTSQRHSGSYSAYASSASNLVSDDLDTSNAESITVSFWYRKHGITGSNNVLLRFYNGINYNNYTLNFVTNAPDDTWLYFSLQTYDRWFLLKNFRIRFDSSGIPSGGQLWIDDVSITTPTRTKDYSGYNNYATVHGATWTSQGVVGGAYQFDGKTDYLRVPDNPSLGGNGTRSEMSVEFWIKPLVGQNGARIVTKKGASESVASYAVGFQTSGTSNTLFWGLTSSFDGAWHEISNPQTVLQTGSWQHVVCTYKSGQGLAIYINGTVCATAAAIGNIAAGPGDSIFGQPLFIGYDGGGDKDSRRYLNGVLDEVRIYDRALSPMQVSQRYDETRRGLSSNSTISWQETNTGDVWRCNLTPNDSFGDGNSLPSNTLTVMPTPGNHPPVAANLAISPSSPRGTDSLTAQYSYSDADGDPEWGTEMRWYKNGVLQPLLNNSLIVPSGLMSKGQVWNFTVLPRDGASFGDLKWIIVTIANSPPSFAGLYITPDPAFNTNTLTAKTFGWSDLDGDPEGYAYQWQKLVSGAWQNIPSQTYATLGPSNFKSNDIVRVNCTAYDGQDYGASLMETKWIADFTLPLQNPLLVSSLGTNTTSEDLICYNTTGTQLTNIYSWNLNNAPWANLLMPFDTNSATTAKDYSGYNNNGAVSGAAWTNQGVVGGAYLFDGSDVITVPDSVSLGGDGSWSEISIEFWIKVAAPLHGTRILAKKIGNLPSGSTGSYMVGFQTSQREPSNTLFFGVTTYDSVSNRTTYYDKWDDTTTALQTGVWYHVVCTYQSGLGLAIYVNGTKRTDRAVTGNITYATPEIGDEPLFIGYDGGSDASRYFSGTLDELKIYPVALTPEQALQRYLETKDKLIKSSTIVSEELQIGQQWKCQVTSNDGSGDTASKSSNTLTIVGSTLKLAVNSAHDSPSPSVGDHFYSVGSSVTCSVTSPVTEGSTMWTCTGWTGTGSVPASGSGSSVTFNIAQNSTITWNWQGAPVYGLLVEVRGSGTTNATGTAMYPSGTSVAVNATPAAGWTLNNWLLNGSNVGSVNPYVVAMTGNRNLTAVFVQINYTLTIQVPAHGTTNPIPGVYNYTSGSSVSVTAIPDSGWGFSYWLRNGVYVSSSNPYNFTIDANYTLTAVFNATYVLNIQTSVGGTTNPSAGNYNYTEGSIVNVSAIASTGWNFSYWIRNGTNIGSLNPLSFTMDASYTLTAVFTQQYQLNIQVLGQGSTNPSVGSYWYDPNSVVPVSATPSVNWNFANWLLDSVNVSSSNSYSVTMDANHTLTAVFNQSVFYVFADGFESGNFGNWTSTIVTSGETATIVTTPVNEGNYSARFASNGGVGEESAYCYKTVNMGEVYARGYVYIGSGLPLVSNGDRFYPIRLIGGSTSLVYAGIRRNNNLDSWVVYVRNGAGWMNYVSNASAPAPVMNSWVCVELHWKNDPTQGLAELYIDGVKIISVTGINTANYGNTTRLDFGLPYSYETNARATNRLTIYGDSVAASNMGPIGPITPMITDWRYLTISVIGTGSTVPAVGNDYPYLYNSAVSVTANPGLGYGFSYWLLNGINFGSSNPYGFTMDANYTLTAVFVPVNYSLTIQVSGQGTTNPSPASYSYPSGSNVSVSAIQDPGWSLSYWLLNGSNVGSANPYTVTMNANHNLTAVFSNSSSYPGGFEDGFNSWNGTSVSSGETATIVTSPINDGSNSASFTSNGGAGEEFAYCYENVNMGEVYVRGYFYIGGGLPLVSNGDRFYLIRLVGTSANLVYAGIRRNNGVDSWVIYVRNGANWMGYVTNASAPAPVMNSWVCVELHWKNDPTQGLAELYINGEKIISVTGINTANYGNAMRIDIGMPYSYETSARATNTVTVYADSAVIDNKYTGP